MYRHQQVEQGRASHETCPSLQGQGDEMPEKRTANSLAYLHMDPSRLAECTLAYKLSAARTSVLHNLEDCILLKCSGPNCPSNTRPPSQPKCKKTRPKSAARHAAQGPQERATVAGSRRLGVMAISRVLNASSLIMSASIRMLLLPLFKFTC